MCRCGNKSGPGVLRTGVRLDGSRVQCMGWPRIPVCTVPQNSLLPEPRGNATVNIHMIHSGVRPSCHPRDDWGGGTSHVCPSRTRTPGPFRLSWACTWRRIQIPMTYAAAPVRQPSYPAYGPPPPRCRPTSACPPPRRPIPPQASSRDRARLLVRACHHGRTRDRGKATSREQRTRVAP